MTQEHIAQDDNPSKEAAVMQPQKYKLQLDKHVFEATSPTVSGQQILAFADKSPEQYKLYQLKPGHQPTEVKSGDSVDLTEPGIERFTSMPRDTTEGRGSNRREFRLASQDEEFLNSLGLPWETIQSGGQWLLLHNWKLPLGLTVPEVSLAVQVPPAYPDTQLDMFYVSPEVGRADGKTINAISNMEICGSQWQRWSRHRTSTNPWRPGIDDIASHLSMIDSSFKAECV